MSRDFLTMDDFDFRGKRVLVRLGIDSPYDRKGIMDNERLVQSALVLKELSGKKAMVVGFGHQGRPGKRDFTTTRRHARLLSRHSGKRVRYIPDIHGPRALKAIRSLKEGQVILLENVRFSREEMLSLSPGGHSRSGLVRDLEPLFDCYIDNAFSNLHRPHASMVGFTRIPNIAGRLVERELEGLRKAREHAGRPYLYILGGVKVADYLDLMESSLSKGTVNKILCAGSIANLILLAKGCDLGVTEGFLKSDKESLGALGRLKKLADKYSKKIMLPVDFMADQNGRARRVGLGELPSRFRIKDIGPETIELFRGEIRKARTIFVKGAPGLYEERAFSRGSRAIMGALSGSRAYTLVGGGSASDMVDRFSSRKRFSHVSMGGGVVLHYLAGKKLPGLEALERSGKRFS